MNKAEEILDKHLENRGWTKTVPKYGNLYNTLLDAVNEALTIPAVVGQSEQLPPFYCPNCGNEWDTNKNNACQCGAYVKR